MKNNAHMFVTNSEFKVRKLIPTQASIVNTYVVLLCLEQMCNYAFLVHMVWFGQNEDLSHSYYIWTWIQTLTDNFRWHNQDQDILHGIIDHKVASNK